MKQLEDGGMAFRASIPHNFKTALKNFWGVFILFMLSILYLSYKIHDYSLFLSPQLWLMGLGIYVSVSAFMTLGLILPARNFTIYDQYISWSWKKEKYFFQELQGFFLKTILAHGLYRVYFEEEVLYCTLKKSMSIAPFYIYFSRLSKQDQQLLLKLLQDKGLIFLPGDYKPN